MAGLLREPASLKQVRDSWSFKPRSDTLGQDNGGDFRQVLLRPPRAAISACDSQVHSAPALVSGSHLAPTLCTPLRRLLFLIVVFWLFDLAIVYSILDRLSSPLRLRRDRGEEEQLRSLRKVRRAVARSRTACRVAWLLRELRLAPFIKWAGILGDSLPFLAHMVGGVPPATRVDPVVVRQRNESAHVRRMLSLRVEDHPTGRHQPSDSTVRLS
jgi:hypothetical protein